MLSTPTDTSVRATAEAWQTRKFHMHFSDKLHGDYSTTTSFRVQRIQLASVYKGETELGRRLTVESVVDVLQLARLFDAPDLFLKCLNLLLREEKAVQGTEGWKFLQDNDPYLEQEILQFLEETESTDTFETPPTVNELYLHLHTVNHDRVTFIDTRSERFYVSIELRAK
ncbi:hypothetical protein Syun_002087 [Stephania yunnanensis]|uniref:Uncharacterized protein n=1 Tax=Stephania yunnanensis TaxID=152371 RepID=A0AAP0LET3_9MAGN